MWGHSSGAFEAETIGRADKKTLHCVVKVSSNCADSPHPRRHLPKQASPVFGSPLKCVACCRRANNVYGKQQQREKN
jgi:hypothetical protein